MRIPNGPKGTEAEGHPTLHTQHVRVYGAGGFALADQEAEQGCPRQYRQRYVDFNPSAYKESDPLRYGTVIHKTLDLMEREPIGPEDALTRCWDHRLPPDMFAEARSDLDNYLARGGPGAKYGTVATETELVAKLYDDDEFGPVFFGGTIDHLGIDVNEPTTLHVTDYKTDRRPRGRVSMKGDVQLRGYAWLVRENWRRFMPAGSRPSIVTHVDLIRLYDLEWWYDDAELGEWQAWAEAIARRILRDEEGAPIVGPGCAWCPIKLDCPAYKRLPGQGVGLYERRATTDLATLVQWREAAAQTIRILAAGIDDVDQIIAERVDAEEGVRIGDTIYERVDSEKRRVDVRALHALVGDVFYDVASVPIDKALALGKGDPTLHTAIEGIIAPRVEGTKIAKRKVEPEGDGG